MIISDCKQLARLFLGLFDCPIRFISIFFDLLGWDIVYNYHGLSGLYRVGKIS